MSDGGEPRALRGQRILFLLRTVLLSGLIGAAIFRLFRAAWTDSMDFTVYWQAAQTWVGGSSPYQLAEFKPGFVFKYPPWILAWFFPFGWIPEMAARLVWAAIELACLTYSFMRLRSFGLAWRSIGIGAALFWWIWLGHFFAGQFTLVLLAAGLWAFPLPGTPSSPLRSGILGVVFSSKIFSAVSLIGLTREVLRPRALVWAAGPALLGTAFVVLWLRFRGSSLGPLELLLQWLTDAASGGTKLPASVIRGQMNHGFTAALLRAFDIDAARTTADLGVFVLLSVVFGVTWHRCASALDGLARWSGWLALGVLVHPLAWHHSFVLAFPLCAVALDRAWRNGHPARITLALTSCVCIGLIVPNIWGVAAVTPLELIGIKSWGICIAAISVTLSSTPQSTRA